MGLDYNIIITVDMYNFINMRFANSTKFLPLSVLIITKIVMYTILASLIVKWETVSFP